MTDTPKNQPTFHIQQVGNINTGDMTIHGDQIGIQHQSIQEKKQKEQPKNVGLPQASLSTMPNASLKPLTVFFSYAHEDEALRDKLATHLKSMEREGLIQGWSDRQISPGSEWGATIKQQLSAAKAGGVEAVKQLLDYVFKNPVATVVAESVKAFVEAGG